MTVVAPLADLDRMVAAYATEGDTDRRERIRDAYNALTGDDVENRKRVLSD